MLVRTLAMLGHATLWRATHGPWFAQRLVDGLSERDETTRGVAGIMLAKGGTAAIPVLRRALAERRGLPHVLTLLGDVGDAAVEPQLRSFTADEDPQVAQAARDALRVLALRLTPSAAPGR
jgi:hypothetical protein